MTERQASGADLVAQAKVGLGRFITFEGGEGAGKSTQARLLADGLRTAGIECVLTREPGGAPGAEVLRGLLLAPDAEWAAQTELLLHFAARAEHVSKTILPALQRGAWVVCDRFTDSTMAYQGFGLAGNRGQIAELGRMMAASPDLTLVLDVPEEVALARLAQRPGAMLDRYERLGPEFFARVNGAFRVIAAEAPERCAVVAAGGDLASVQAEIWRVVAARFGIAA